MSKGLKSGEKFVRMKVLRKKEINAKRKWTQKKKIEGGVEERGTSK